METRREDNKMTPDNHSCNPDICKICSGLLPLFLSLRVSASPCLRVCSSLRPSFCQSDGIVLC